VRRARIESTFCTNSSFWCLPSAYRKVETVGSGDTVQVISYLAGRRLAAQRVSHNVLMNKFRDSDCHFLQLSGRSRFSRSALALCVERLSIAGENSGEGGIWEHLALRLVRSRAVFMTTRGTIDIDMVVLCEGREPQGTVARLCAPYHRQANSGKGYPWQFV
jgi:hypothetical protein